MKEKRALTACRGRKLETPETLLARIRASREIDTSWDGAAAAACSSQKHLQLLSPPTLNTACEAPSAYLSRATEVYAQHGQQLPESMLAQEACPASLNVSHSWDSREA